MRRERRETVVTVADNDPELNIAWPRTVRWSAQASPGQDIKGGLAVRAHLRGT